MSNGLSCSENIEENGAISPVTKDTIGRNESIKLQTGILTIKIYLYSSNNMSNHKL